MAFVGPVCLPLLRNSAGIKAFSRNISRRTVGCAPVFRASIRMSSTTSEEAAAKRANELRGPEGIFSKIISKDIPADILYEDDKCLAFKDLNPQAPVHFLVIPKTRIALLQDAKESEAALLGHLMLAAAEAARIAKLETGYRVIVNNGYDGLQSVGHLHLHVVGGCKLKWGPFHD